MRRAAYGGVKLVSALIRREQLVRVTRFINNAVRLDFPNEIGQNGEMMVLGTVMKAHSGHLPVVVLDCGANVGRYSAAVRQIAEKSQRDLVLYSFEPAAWTFERLQENLKTTMAGCKVHLHRIALSDSPAVTATFRVTSPGAGTNTLVGNALGERSVQEQVKVSTVDLFCAQHRIDTVDLLKIDTEGNDYNVIKGAEGMLGAGRIRVVQFEYNYRWVYARRFLRDVFELLNPLRYCLGKITPDGIEFYPGWHPELEKFVEGNYVACSEATRSIFPGVPWWGDRLGIASPDR